MPPSWGAARLPPLSPSLLAPPPPALSLLLLFRLVGIPLTGGASPLGGFPKPGIAGAPTAGGPNVELDPLSKIGPD